MKGLGRDKGDSRDGGAWGIFPAARTLCLDYLSPYQCHLACIYKRPCINTVEVHSA